MRLPGAPSGLHSIRQGMMLRNELCAKWSVALLASGSSTLCSCPYLTEHILQLVDGRYDALPQRSAGQKAQGRAPRRRLRLHWQQAQAAAASGVWRPAEARQPGSAVHSS